MLKRELTLWPVRERHAKRKRQWHIKGCVNGVEWTQILFSKSLPSIKYMSVVIMSFHSGDFYWHLGAFLGWRVWSSQHRPIPADNKQLTHKQAHLVCENQPVQSLHRRPCPLWSSHTPGHHLLTLAFLWWVPQTKCLCPHKTHLPKF